MATQCQQSDDVGTKNGLKRNKKNENIGILSPRFRSAAELAGWDEEALLLATLVVEDTPDRECKSRRRITHQPNNPDAHLSSSGRKRRRQPLASTVEISVVLRLDDDSDLVPQEVEGKGNAKEEDIKQKKQQQQQQQVDTGVAKKNHEDKKDECRDLSNKDVGGSSQPLLPICLDKLREELTCAICLDICYEPSTTSCGHSFCKGCLKKTAEKCGRRCPKCREMISIGRACTVNTVLWNTIQLIFPAEVEAKKAASANITEKTDKEAVRYDSRRLRPWPSSNRQTRSSFESTTSQSEDAALAAQLQREELLRASRPANRPSSRRTSRNTFEGPSQSEDVALAFSLQREEFVGSRRHDSHGLSSVFSARANLRAMATRAINHRNRARPT